MGRIKRMKYTKEIADQMALDYNNGVPVSEIAEKLQVPDRSVVAKLSAMGIYKRKEYRNKRGEVPVKKEEYIDRIAKSLNVHVDILESLEKANKRVLELLDKALKREDN